MDMNREDIMANNNAASEKVVTKFMGETGLKLGKIFDTIASIEIGNSIILVCAKVGTTRLIDNLWI